MELDLLKLLSTKDLYTKYKSYMKPERMSSEGQDILNSLDDFYNDTGKSEIKWLEDFYTWYTTLKHPSLAESKVTILKSWCEKLDDLTAPNEAVLQSFLERDYSAQIGDLCIEIVDGTGKATMTDIIDKLEGFKSESRLTNQFLEGERVSIDDLEDQLQDLDVSQKFEWRLNELQLSLGSIKQGDFIIVGARPDSGKTTFLASEVTYFAKQLEDGQCILWLNNEEMLQRVRQRQAQAALNWTYSEIMADPAVTTEKYQDALGGPGRIVTYDDSKMSIADVDKAVALYEPSLIVIDQLWKLEGYEKESTSEVDRFARIAKHLRSLAKETGPVITTSQLDGTADGNKWPEMGSLYNSKTAIQGEADAIIMIGIDLETSPVARYIRAPKNKLPFGDPKQRNSGHIVTIDAEHARYVSAIARPKGGK